MNLQKVLPIESGISHRPTHYVTNILLANILNYHKTHWYISSKIVINEGRRYIIEV